MYLKLLKTNALHLSCNHLSVAECVVPTFFIDVSSSETGVTAISDHSKICLLQATLGSDNQCGGLAAS